MRTPFIIALSAVASLAAPSLAAADAESAALLVDATQIMPKSGVHSGAVGPGVELRFVPDDEPVTMSIGGFAAVGERGASLRRDVLDVHFQIGFKPERMKIAPYASLGLDVLHITTHEMDTSYRGTTLGLSAQAGLLGTIGDHAVLRATVGYLGAIVPGSGDDLGGLVLQAGVGWMMDD